MLVEFTVENYKSFRDRTTLSMVAAKITSFEKSLDQENVIEAKPDLKLLRSAAIYGPNASGKSNLASALAFMRSFVIGSARELQAEDPINIEPFLLSTATENEPSLFEVVFIVEGIEYRYGFQANKEQVISEWLYGGFSTKETTLFTRDEQEIKVGARFREGKGIENKTRPNALFLSVAAQFNVELALELLHWFRVLTVTSGLEDIDFRDNMLIALREKELRQSIVEIVKQLDVNILDLTVRERHPMIQSAKTGKWVVGPVDRNQGTVLSRHIVYDNEGNTKKIRNFEIEEHESQGTRKIIALVSFIVNVLQNGHVLFVDELDARLHPLITQAIIKLFNSQITNSGNAQLIFITHDTNLLDKSLLRRDQIWFAEKDRHAVTHLTSLVEYRVRNDESYEKNYIQGRYGAIPFIGDLTHLPEALNA